MAYKPDKPTKTSAVGKSAIRHREKDVPHYESYHSKHEDNKHSIGSLTHHHYGHATSKPEEKHSHARHIDTMLAHGIHHAEQIVHRYVKQAHLTQAQFDALVSYVHSVGEHHARSALHATNRGDRHSAARHIEQSVYIHHHSAENPLQTHAPIKSRLLAKRRHEEAKPFTHTKTTSHPYTKKFDQPHGKKSEQKSGHHSAHLSALKPEHPFAHHSDHAYGQKSEQPHASTSHNSHDHGWDPFKVFAHKR